jgi:3-phenylpropionate/trans-cinnamate dioxygenase ferredoxin reductase subunit
VNVVIVGAGQAGFQAAATLRAEGYQDSITLLGEELHLPYQRPPLSKGILLGKQEPRHAILRPAAFYQAQRIELVAGVRVTAIDPASRAVLAGPRRIGYDALVLATGARNRILAIPGASLDGVCYLRSLNESLELRQRIASARRVVIIGGGFIGLEVAAAARTLGRDVTVIEVRERLLARAVAPLVSDFIRARHEAQGVEVLTGAQVEAIRGEHGKVREVVLRGGARRPADAVVVGVGVAPNIELAQAAGLKVADGIAVDAELRTSDPRIFAIGDCAEHPNPYAGARVRLESVENAVDQGAAAARSILGRGGPYRAVPWFWTDQFDVHLQMAGISAGFDQTVLRGDPASGKFSMFYFRAGRLIAVDSVNRPGEHLAARKLIEAGARITPQQAADQSFDLRAGTGSQTAPPAG